MFCMLVINICLPSNNLWHFSEIWRELTLFNTLPPRLSEVWRERFKLADKHKL